MTIIPDTKDWTWVLQRACPECGFDARSLPREQIPALLLANAQEWAQALGGPGDPRARPWPDVWSPLEYACHVRDVCRLSTPEMTPYIGPGSLPLTDAEREYLAQLRHWDETERGYSTVQSTRPQTLGYGLTDSPAALAAWVLEKWRLWADSGGALDATFDRDVLLTMLTGRRRTGHSPATLR